MQNRYAQLIELVRDLRPLSIVEIGVHRGRRATILCAEALRYRKNVSYLGFDVFDTKDEAFQAAAMNGKGTPTEAQARAALNKVLARYPEFKYSFKIGDTRETLRDRNIQADFVFIDGDHRVETIASDYSAVAESTCIAFDDYIVHGPNGEGPDLRLYGANVVVDSLINSGKNVRILPIADLCKHGGYAKIAVLKNGNW